MKNHEDLHNILDKALDDLDSGEIDSDRAGSIARLAGNKISLVREQLKHKKLTNSPKKLQFFENH